MNETGAAGRSLGHVASLDGLRGVAVILVTAYHLDLILVGPAIGRWLIPGGFLGVDLFFVLSGFLITTLALEEQHRTGGLDIGRFFVRRALRLLPALVACLAAYLVYTVVADRPLGLALRTVRDALLYVSNWSWRWDGQEADQAMSHLWSLAIEEQFYIAWAFLMAAFLGARRATAPVVLAIGSAIVLVAAQRYRLFAAGEPIFFVYRRTDCRIDALLVGALLAQVRFRTTWRPTARWATGLAVVATLGVAASVLEVGPLDRRLYQGGFTVAAILIAILLWVSIDGAWRNSPLLTPRLLQEIGRRSYGAYLWHLPIIVAIAEAPTGSWPAWAQVGLALLLTSIATIASWEIVERPAAALKRRWGTVVGTDAPDGDGRSRTSPGHRGTVSPR